MGTRWAYSSALLGALAGLSLAWAAPALAHTFKEGPNTFYEDSGNCFNATVSLDDGPHYTGEFWANTDYRTDFTIAGTTVPCSWSSEMAGGDLGSRIQLLKNTTSGPALCFDSYWHYSLWSGDTFYHGYTSPNDTKGPCGDGYYFAKANHKGRLYGVWHGSPAWATEQHYLKVIDPTICYVDPFLCVIP